MKIKFKISFIVIGIQAVLVTGIAVLLLNHAANIQLQTSQEKQAFLAKYQSSVIQDRYNGYIRVAKTLAGIFSEYQGVEESVRRVRFAANIDAVLDNEPNIVSIFSVWKPNTLSRNIMEHTGEGDSAPTGQFAPFFHKYSGRVTHTFYPGYEELTRNMPNTQTVTGPVMQTVQGKSLYLMTFIVPVIEKESNTLAAVVGVEIDVSALEELVTKTIADNEDISYMAVYTNAGDILASYQSERMGKNIRAGDSTLFLRHMEEVISAIKAGRLFTTTEYSSLLKTELTITMAPFGISDSGVTWTVGVGTPQSLILREIKRLTIFTIILAGMALILGTLIILGVTSGLVKPIVRVAETLRNISEGEGDLTQSIEEIGKDEITDMAHYFNLTIDKIRRMIRAIKEQTGSLADLGADLAANMTESAAAVNEIAANIQSVKGKITNQTEGVRETNAAMTQITGALDTLNEHIEKQTIRVSQSSSSIEEMVANINSVTQTLIKNAENMEQLTEASDAGRGGLQEVAVEIREVAAESEGLLAINGVIANIASQTNLLAMNAAIEAAHAGDVGRGFAVVADEIRKLAESSSTQSKTISSALKKIKTAIDKITASTDGVLRKFEAIDTGVKTVSEQEANVRAAMEEQGTGSKQILEAVEQLNTITRQVEANSVQMLEGSKSVMQESKNLEQVTEEIANGMNEMASGSAQINAAVNRVNDLSFHNKASIETLVQEVSRFKID